MPKVNFEKHNIAARAGRASAAPHGPGRDVSLDLSQGHIGTSGDVQPGSIEVEHFGPFKVVCDLRSGKATVFTDASAFRSRTERRNAEREFLKLSMRAGKGLSLSFAKGGC